MIDFEIDSKLDSIIYFTVGFKNHSMNGIKIMTMLSISFNYFLKS